MTDFYSNKTALITGSARGLGLTIAEDLAKKGVNICATDIRGAELHEQMERIGEQYKIRTLAIPADLGSEREVKNLISRAYETYGRIDVLVNNAGIRKVGPVQEMSMEVWDEIHSSNLKSQFLCTREALRQGMLKQNEGVIIFISSGSGKRGEKNSSAYCASKFGGVGFAQSVARDLKNTRIRVTSIAPGMIWTPMAEESEMADMDLEWLDPAVVSRTVLFCIEQDSNTVIPEVQIYHRAQI